MPIDITNYRRTCIGRWCTIKYFNDLRLVALRTIGTHLHSTRIIAFRRFELRNYFKSQCAMNQT